MKRIQFYGFLTLLFLALVPACAANLDVAGLLAQAKAGATVALPAGTFKTGNLVVPAGVTLQGAGYDRTILDAGGQDCGLLLKNVRGVTLAGFTIEGAAVSGVRIEGSAAVTLSGLRLVRNLCGVNAAASTQLRLENLVLAENRTGVALNAITDGTLVNCTLADNTALGLTITHSSHVTAFNNIITGSDTGIILPQNNDNLQMDYNLWHGLVIGILEGEYNRHTVTAWHALTGLEAHSLSLPITFSNPARDEYWPVSTLAWRPTRAVTYGWGTDTFAGAAAPRTDIRGQRRSQDLDVGAFATGLLSADPPDGVITITMAEGVKSAGVFRKDGTLLCYLFQGLPLRKGRYPFWLPARDFLARPIQPGAYEVRVVQSPVSCDYLGFVGNKGIDNTPIKGNQENVNLISYDDDGQLIVGNGWQERGINLVKLDPLTGNTAWGFGGNSTMNGLAFVAAHQLDVLKTGSNGLEMVQIDTRSGEAQPWPNGDYKCFFPKLSGNEPKHRLAYLHGRLYLADTKANTLYTAPAQQPDFSETLSVPAPECPAADEQHDLVWVISGGKTLLALDDKGQVRQTYAQISKPVALAIRNGRMAVASADTGKVSVLDCTNPAILRLLFTIGTGEDPVGPIQPDRFEFKDSQLGGAPCAKIDLAVGPHGEIAVLHNNRIAMFDAAGKLVRDTWADFSWDMLPINFDDGGPTGFYNAKGASFCIDARAQSWRQQANWVFPKDYKVMRFFAMGGKHYTAGQLQFPKDQADGWHGMAWAICVLDGYVARIVKLYRFDDTARRWLVYTDNNGGHVFSAKDTPQPWTLDNGQPITDGNFIYGCFASRDGSLSFTNAVDGYPQTSLWEPNKLLRGILLRIEADEQGVPALAIHKEDALLQADDLIPSPYDPAKMEKLESPAHLGGVLPLVQGTWIANPSLPTAPVTVGSELGNWVGTNVAGFSADGSLRWLRLLTDPGPMIAMCRINHLVATIANYEAEVNTMTDDGLSTGNFGQPLAAHFRNGLEDHANVLQPFIGNDGLQYFLLGDYATDCSKWYALRHTDAIVRNAFPLRVSAARAESLLGQPLLAVEKNQTKSPTVVVRKLRAPLPIDGDLVKWRNTGIAPQIYLTPANPAECSAVVRLAYEGDNLYVQVLRFAKRIVMFQTAKLFYLQDALEVSINGYAEGGFKYNLTRVRDQGDFLYRDRWFADKLSYALDPAVAPRKIVVLDNAKDVEERKVIESLTGADLSNAKVIVYEFKLPMTECYNKDQSFNKEAGWPERRIEMKSGGSFRLGLLIDDSDQPGADTVRPYNWPASYNTWSTLEQHAEAKLE